MALRILITERQRRIGSELRKLRTQAGFTVAEGGRLIDMGSPHLSHVEAGRTGIPTQRLRELVCGYGLSNEAYVDALVSMAESNGKGWWSEYRKSRPQSSLDLAELEASATSLQSHETLLIPGLLQTESYMRALFCAGLPDASPEEVETAVSYRRARQSVLDSDPPISFHAVIHEAALRIEVGGSQVMRDQLTHLIRMAGHPGVTIQVLPFESGARAWFGNPFHIVDPGVPGLETVVVEHPANPLRLDDFESIVGYGATFSSLSQTALPAVDSDGSLERHERRDSWGLIQHLLYTH
ncbi:helix-turn-helix transcriptional regulator [Streptomyces sp. 21So2-11]|uniref:helix-turn-helix domain-containing protein n=1 Tax=Streptomyces sp. 21So2-11 TaxID=3144408 RepID=UPI00321A701C